jgi:hypothetical protein
MKVIRIKIDLSIRFYNEISSNSQLIYGFIFFYSFLKF